MLKQNARKRVMDNFRSGQLEALIGTDIIARGIDVKNIDAVINYDIPQSSELYVHRIGRTGRSGAVGKSYLLIGKNEIGKISRLASITKSKIDELKIPGLEYDASMKNETESHRNETSSRYGDDAIRLFMNIGTKDGFDRASLTKYINDHSDLIPTDILDMYLNETYGFITIKKDKQPMLQTITNINGRDVKFDVSNPRKSHRAFNNRPSRSGYNKGGFSRHRNNDNRRGGFNNNEKRRTYDNSNRPTTKFNRYKNDSFRGK
jgi:superfamily II DNA/RNA helicase